MKIASAAYPLSWFDNFDQYEAKLADWVAEAAGHGADLLVFPEYGAMELASLAGPDVAGDMEAALQAVAGYLPQADACHARLAQKHGVHILAASAPAMTDQPRPVNQARLFAPSGEMVAQDKQIRIPTLPNSVSITCKAAPGTTSISARSTIVMICLSCATISPLGAKSRAWFTGLG